MDNAENRKRTASVIVAAMPPPDKLKEKSGGALNNDDDMKEREDDDGAEAAETSAFGDLRAALKSGDDKAGRAALNEYLELCGYKRGE